jgi:L-iditol 2-dehydrogenase
MRVAVWYSNRDVRVEERPVPEIGPGEVLVRIEACGLCGSDGMEWYRLHKAPLVLGHEVSGEVAEVGQGVQTLRVGDRVSVAHHVPCNTCPSCLNGHHAVCKTLQSTGFDPGGFSEFVRVPALNVDRGVFRLPDEVSHEDATFAEPLGCVVRGQRLARLRPGETVFVAGCGISAQLHILAARALGAGRIIALDSIDFRLRTALQSGADAVLSSEENVPDQVREINGGLLADRVIVCRETLIPQALRSVERGGTVLFFAAAGEQDRIPLTVNELFWRTEITLTSSYAAPPADTWTALRLIRSRRVPVTDLITHRLALAETGRGFHMLTHPAEQDSMKIVIRPQR